MKKKKLLYILIPISIIIILPLIAYICIRNCINKYPTTIKPTEEFCIEGFFPFPHLFQIQSDIPSSVEVGEKTTIFNNIDILARKICIKPNALLAENKTYSLDISYLNIFEKNIPLTTEEYPQIQGVHTEEEIPDNHIFKYEIEYTEELLDYYLISNNASVLCTKDGNYILCDIENLNLTPGETYNVNLVSKYGESTVEDIENVKVNVLDSVKIISSSIKNKSVIQSTSIKEILITLNKDIEDTYNITIQDSSNNNIGNNVSVNGKVISIEPTSIFKQNTQYYLKISNLTGTDGSSLRGEYILEFTIDDGPRISSTNISSSFSVSGNILLTFNQSIKTQDIKQYIKLNSKTEYSYSISGTRITINPTSNLGACRNHSLSVNKGIVGTNDLISSQSYSYTISTQCKRTTSIGTSVQGRSIYATYFGYGSKKIILFAAMHGSEANTKSTLNKLIADIDSNRSKVPTDKTIIIIPTLNPDGIANKSRFNANGVDLNRNFDSSTWVSGTYFLQNYYPTGGGAYPFSEPESIAIRNLLARENPYLTISYHSAAGYVIPTNTTRGLATARIYSNLSGYTYTPPGTEGDFSYDITGTFEEWAQEHGYSGMVIELSSAYVDQYTQNRSAIWEMIEYD
ncbi:MAG: DUF2817 domain-containing protein [Candidatus Dojkabacteria bacterium]|nr:DUF2817 domain-containing protein [Candidatus Dojkabacteria bacterium]